MVSISPGSRSVMHDRIEDCLACAEAATGAELPTFESALRSLIIPASQEIPQHLQGCINRINYILDEFQIKSQEERSSVLRPHVFTKIREETLRLVLKDGHDLQFANEDLKNDLGIVLAATRHMGELFVHAGNGIKNTGEAVLTVVTENRHAQELGCSARHASLEVLDNYDFARRAVKVCGLCLEYLSPRDKNDPEIVRDAIKEASYSFSGAGDEIKDNKTFVREAMQTYHVSFTSIGPSCKDDEEFVLPEVCQNGDSLSLVSDRLKDNKEVVLGAVRNDGWALRHASDRLKRDVDVVFAATRQNRRAAQWAGVNVKAV